MRDQSIEVMLVGGPTRGESDRDAEIGIKEEGKQLDDERYQFRLLDNIKVPESDDEDSIAAQINRRNDSCRMFTNELEIVVGREAILKRARDFAKQHPDILSGVLLRVPNEFGALCAYPNAYCMIALPKTRAAFRHSLNSFKCNLKAQVFYWLRRHVRLAVKQRNFCVSVYDSSQP